MDDQFNGRTDDDLFADDFEPVAAPVTTESRPDAPAAEPVAASVPATESQQQNPAPSATQTTSTTAPPTAPSAQRSLAQSRHAKPAHQHQQRPRKRSPHAKKTPPTTDPTVSTANSNNNGDSSAPSTTVEASGPSTSETPSTHHNPRTTGQNTALADRLASGQNPRTKLTDTELADKMERMRILSAEKARKFEQAEQDSRSHAIAYEEGMKEARKRRAEEAEKRRRGEEERRQMDQERAANRERKLKALGGKEGGWDEGKTTEQEERRGGFRGANGGIRGSRFASRNGDEGAGEESPMREFAPDEFRGRGGRGGRGRGDRRGGRGGGRGGFADGAKNNRDTVQQPKKVDQKPPTANDFPALPPGKLDTTTDTKPAVMSLSPGLNSPPIGKWDDEMAALDDKV